MSPGQDGLKNSLAVPMTLGLFFPPAHRRAERSLVALPPSPDLFVHARELLVEANRFDATKAGKTVGQEQRPSDVPNRRRLPRGSCKVRVTNGLPCEPVVRSFAPFPAREAKAGAPVLP
jgi:hypothetical protein